MANIKGITIEIDGNTTKLDKSLRDVNKTSREVNKELRGIRNSLKFNPKSTELMAQKQRVLGESIENTKKKLDQLKEAQAQAARQLANGDIGQDEYDALRREIIKTENQLKSLSRQQDEITNKWKRAGKEMQAFGGKVDKAGQQIGSVGKDMTAKVTAPIVGLGTLAAKSAIDFETAFAGVRKTVDASEAEFAELEKGIRNMSKELPASAAEIAGVAEAAGQLGIKKENILEFTKTMINLGEATNMTAEEAATSFARFANITQMPQDKMNNLGSAVVELGNNLATTEQEIVDMGLRLAGTGSQIGLTEAEIMGLAGAMSSVGIQAEAGGTAMSTVMTKINTAVADAGEGLDEFAKISGMTSAEFAQAWEEDPTQAIESFVAGLGEVTTAGGNVDQTLKDLGISGIRETDTLKRLAGAGDLLGKSFDLASGAFENNTALTKEAEERYKALASKLAMMKNKLMEVGITVGEKLMPYIEKFVDWLGQLADKISEMDPWLLDLVIKFAALAAAVGPVMMILGPIVSLVGKIIGVIGLFSQAIGVVTSGIAVASPVVMGIAAVLSKLGIVFGVVKGIVIAFAAALNLPVIAAVAVGAAIAAVVYAIVTNWETVKTKTIEILTAIVAYVFGKFTELKNNTIAEWEAIKNAITTAINMAKTIVTTVVGAIRGFISGVWNGIKSTTARVWNNVLSAIKTPIEKARDIVKGAIEKIKSFLNITLPFPKIKLPHFTISGSFSLKPPRVPSFGVDWYDKGGIFSSPSIIGVGEKRPEFVGALDDLKTLIREVLEEKGVGGEVDLSGIGDGQSSILIKELVDEVRNLIYTVGNKDIVVAVGDREIARATYKYVAEFTKRDNKMRSRRRGEV